MNISKYKILVVDDEQEILDMIKNFLSLQGYSVECCSSPKEALRRLEDDNFKILITDIMMPEMSGVDLIKAAKEQNGLLQVIAITGFVTTENIIRVFKFGANNCLFKPFETMGVIKVEIDLAIEKLEKIKAVLSERLKRKE